MAHLMLMMRAPAAGRTGLMLMMLALTLPPNPADAYDARLWWVLVAYAL